MDGTVDSGRLGGICCRKFSPLKRFEPCRDRAESECIYRYANLLLPRRVRLPQCSLLFGPRDSLTHPPSLYTEWVTKPPTPTSPLRCSIELRAGSIQDSDLGFSHRMARAFGALRAAPLPREHGERVTK